MGGSSPTLTVSPQAGGACRFVVRAAPSHPLMPAAFCSSIVAALVAAVLSGRLMPLSAALLLSTLLGSWWLHRRFAIDEESLTAIEGIGLQLCTRSASGRETARFIEVAAISAVFLAEAVRFDRCYFYLACLLHGEEVEDGGGAPPQMVVPFHHLLPPLSDLQTVLRGVHNVLWRGAEPAGAGPASSSSMSSSRHVR